MSAVSSGTSTSLSACGGAILDAICAGESAVVGHLLEVLTAAYTSTTWPISKAAMLFAAVTMGKKNITAQLLRAGAPGQFIVAELPSSDCSSLASAGISVDGVAHMSPLVIAVRQQNYEVARILLESGALASVCIGGVPLLVHYHIVVTSPSAPRPSPDRLAPIGGLLVDSHHSSPGITSAGLLGGQGSSNDGGQAGMHSVHSSSSDVATMIQDLDKRLRILSLLLRHGADPLQRTIDGQHSFLKMCTQPAMLRLAVNFVLEQCSAGRAVDNADAALICDAAGRAYLQGF